MCELVEAGLRERGHDVTWRLTAEEALVELEQHEYTAMLVDIQMDGKERPRPLPRGSRKTS